MKKFILFALLTACTSASIAYAQNSAVIDGYTLYGCKTDGAENYGSKNYCKTHKNDLRKIIKQAQGMKPNFDKNKKLIQVFYKNDIGPITEIFVVDEKARKIYLKPHLAYFNPIYVENPTKSPRVMSDVKHSTFCLYQEGAWFTEDYIEGYISTSPVVEKGLEDDKLLYLCSTFNSKDENVFTHYDDEYREYEAYSKLFDL